MPQQQPSRDTYQQPSHRDEARPGASAHTSHTPPAAAPAQQSSGPRGGIDLSSMANQSGTTASRDDELLLHQKQEGEGAHDTGVEGELIVAVDESNFEATAQLSLRVPIVVQFWAEWCGPCRQLKPVMEELAREYGGRFQLAQIDIDKARGVAQAFQVQSVPVVFAIVRGQPLPLFQGALPKAQVKQYLNKVLEAARQAGVTGRLAVEQKPPEPTAAQRAIQEALDAEDFDTAEALLMKEQENHPGDSDIKAALAQLRLQRRLSEEETDSADNSDPMMLADQFISHGNSPAAYRLLLDALKNSEDDQREKIRERIIELFTVDADKDAVSQARRELSRLLFG